MNEPILAKVKEAILGPDQTKDHARRRRGLVLSVAGVATLFLGGSSWRENIYIPDQSNIIDGAYALTGLYYPGQISKVDIGYDDGAKIEIAIETELTEGDDGKLQIVNQTNVVSFYDADSDSPRETNPNRSYFTDVNSFGAGRTITSIDFRGPQETDLFEDVSFRNKVGAYFEELVESPGIYRDHTDENGLHMQFNFDN
jgi:hypothetical protein